MSDSARIIALFLVLATAFSACRSVDIVATRISGPRLRVGDNARSRMDCPNGSGAASAFLHALCVCEDYTAGNRLLTDAVDSDAPDYPATSPGGSVGVNGRIGNRADYMQVGGSLLVAGPKGVSLFPSVSPADVLYIGEDLQIGGALEGAGCGVVVEGDARVAGRLDLNDLRVGGQLSIPEGVEINVKNDYDQVVLREPVQVDPPCGCDEQDLKDISAIVNQAEADNDNAKLDDFDLAELEDYQGPISLMLPSGRFFLSRLSGQGELELKIKGRAALYVLDQVHFAGPFIVQLEEGAELDLFFAGDLEAYDRLELGSPDQPERVRLYVGGAGAVNLSGADRSWLCGHLYAPRAELVTAGPLEVFGSVFARRVNNDGRLQIHYDRNPLEAGNACP